MQCSPRQSTESTAHTRESSAAVQVEFTSTTEHLPLQGACSPPSVGGTAVVYHQPLWCRVKEERGCPCSSRSLELVTKSLADGAVWAGAPYSGDERLPCARNEHERFPSSIVQETKGFHGDIASSRRQRDDADLSIRLTEPSPRPSRPLTASQASVVIEAAPFVMD